MAHMWDRGVLNASSWHGLEEVGCFAAPGALLAHGQRCGAYPISLRAETLRTGGGLVAKSKAIVGSYQSPEHPDRILGTVGGRYRATTPTEWAELIAAAEKAGAQATGAFSLCEGSRALATFEVGLSNGLRTFLVLADSFDGSLSLTAGFTSVRVVCANTLAVSMRQDGAAMAKLRHTASLEDKVVALREGIDEGIKSGQAVRDTFAKAADTQLTRAAASAAFDALFPPAPDGASPTSKTRAENARHDARLAAALPINRVGDEPGNLATLWNAATYLVDRTAQGSHRPARGDGDSLNSLLFGSRAQRLSEIQHTIEVVLRDGTVERRATTDVLASGAVDPRSVGRTVLADMLSDM